MYFSTLALGLAAAAGLVSADPRAFLSLHNNCPEPVYLVYSTEAGGPYQSLSATINSGQTIPITLAGSGLSVGLSVNPDFYAGTTAKLIMGYSINTPDNLLYYSFANDDGDPFAGQPWVLTSTNPQCTSVGSANLVTYACAAGSNLDLTLCR